MPRALVVGVNGQDGSYLAEHLVDLGWQVWGIGRQMESRYVPQGTNFQYQKLDLTQGAALSALLNDVRPERIYYLAAVHGASGFVYEDKWQNALQVNLGNVHICLEYMRLQAPSCRLLYASSLKAFGATPPKVVSEKSLRISTCLYSITKNSARDLIDYYRKTHDVRGSVLYLLNHDSPRRPRHFFIPKITDILAAAMKGEIDQKQSVYTLDFACDWGSAAEFMQIGQRILEHDANEDYVLATGHTWIGSEIVDTIFSAAGLDWRRYVEASVPATSQEIQTYRADTTHLRNNIGVVPKLSAVDVVSWILEEDYGLKLVHDPIGLRVKE